MSLTYQRLNAVERSNSEKIRKTSVFQVYHQTADNLAELIESSFAGVEMSFEDMPGLYIVESGMRRDIEDYIRIVIAKRVNQIWTVNHESKVERILLDGDIDFDLGYVMMPIQNALDQDVKPATMFPNQRRIVRH